MSIDYRSENGVGIFTLDNGSLNLVTMEMHKQFYHDYLRFLHDDKVKVAILVGAGDHFSAGHDLKEIRTDAWRLDNPRWDHMTHGVHRTKPMIAAIKGYCLGAGFLEAMTLTDIRIAGESARLGAPEVLYGFGGMSGVTQLGKHIAPVDAAYLALTGEKINAEKALEMKLVNEVLPDEQVFERALSVANLIARSPLEAIKVELDCLHRGMEQSRLESFQYTHHQYWQSRKQLGDDQKSGQRAVAVMKGLKN